MKRYLFCRWTMCFSLAFLMFFLNGCSKTEQLITAIESSDIETVKIMLNDGVDPNKTDVPTNRFWDFLETSPKRPLAVACEIGNKEIVELLIEYGATAEYIEGTGWSPLMETVWYYQSDDVQIVELLLEHGADPIAVEGSDAPLFVAAKMVPQVYDPMKTNGTVFLEGYDETTAQGITDIVISMLGERSINITSESGMTLLMCSAQSGNYTLAEYLVAHSCDKGAKDVSGKTALDYAVSNGYSEIIALLS